MQKGSRPPDLLLELYFRYRDLCLILDLHPIHFIIKLLASKELRLNLILDDQDGIIAA